MKSAINNSICEAVIKNRRDIINFHCSNGTDFNFRGADKVTPLYLAASRGNTGIAKLLLNSRANPALGHVEKDSPLHVACRRGFIRMVKLLLDYGCDVNILDRYDYTPLYVAVEKGRCDIARALLERGADVSARDELPITSESDQVWRNEKSYTPIHLACKLKLVRMVNLLLEYGCDINIRYDFEMTPLHEAVKYGHYEIVDVLLKKQADVNVTDEDGATPLHYAARNGSVNCARILLYFGADERLLDIISRTALHYAVESGKKSVVKILLEHGSDVNALDANHLSPIHLAVQRHKEGILQLLLERGNRPNLYLYDKQGNTVFHLAAINRNTNLMRKLLQYGFDVNYLSANKRMSAILLAVYTRNFKLVKLLMEHGANFENTPDYQIKMIVLLLNDNYGREIRDYLISRLLCQKAKGLNVDLEVLKKFQQHAPKNYEYLSTLLELSRTMKIGQTSVTYHDFLLKNINVLSNNVRNIEIQNHFSNGNIKLKEFKILIQENYEKAIRRSKLLDETDVLFRQSDIFKNLPHLCKIHVLSFLNNTELETLFLINGGYSFSSRQ